MSITKKILDWNDKKFEEIDENTKHPVLKAIACGVIEGTIDGAVMAYPILMVGCVYWKKKALNK